MIPSKLHKLWQEVADLVFVQEDGNATTQEKNNIEAFDRTSLNEIESIVKSIIRQHEIDQAGKCWFRFERKNWPRTTTKKEYKEVSRWLRTAQRIAWNEIQRQEPNFSQQINDALRDFFMFGESVSYMEGPK